MVWPLVVVDGDRLGEAAEDAVQARARGAQVGDEAGVGEHERDAAGEDLEEREVVGVEASAGAGQAEHADPALGGAQRDRDAGAAVEQARLADACGSGAAAPCSNRRRSVPSGSIRSTQQPSAAAGTSASARPATASSTRSAPDRWPTRGEHRHPRALLGRALERPGGEHGQRRCRRRRS